MHSRTPIDVGGMCHGKWAMDIHEMFHDERSWSSTEFLFTTHVTDGMERHRIPWKSIQDCARNTCMFDAPGEGSWFVQHVQSSSVVWH